MADQADTVFRRMMHQFIPPAATSEDQAERDRTWWSGPRHPVSPCSTDAQVGVANGATGHSAQLHAPVHPRQGHHGRAARHTSDIRRGRRGVDRVPDAPVGLTARCTLLVVRELTQVHRTSSLAVRVQGNDYKRLASLTHADPPSHADGLPLLIKAMKINADIIHFFRDFGRSGHSIESVKRGHTCSALTLDHTARIRGRSSSARTLRPCAAPCRLRGGLQTTASA